MQSIPKQAMDWFALPSLADKRGFLCCIAGIFTHPRYCQEVDIKVSLEGIENRILLLVQRL